MTSNQCVKDTKKNNTLNYFNIFRVLFYHSRPEIYANPKSSAALAVVCRATSSIATPLISATRCAISGMWLLSLRLPL